MEKELKLPPTDAETAEERLEELVTHKTVKLYRISHQDCNIWVEYFDCRLYPDGFEAVINSNEGLIYVDRRRTFVHYNLQKDREIQKEQGKD